MLESFPFGRIPDHLEEEDFTLFANGYRQLVLARIPSSGLVHFVLGGPLPKLSTDPRIDAAISAQVESMKQGEITTSKLGTTILLSFPVKKEQFLVIAVSQVDPMIAELGTLDWLEDIRESLLREFHVLKNSYRDLETGLLNSSHFWDVLEKSKGCDSGVILVQLPSRGRLPRDSYQNGQRAATALVGFTDSRLLVHHLGQSVFGILGAKEDLGSVERFSSGLVQHLKREGFFRVHVGSSSKSAADVAPPSMLDEAWTALQVAAKRGPFSFCDYSFLANADTHPLRPVNSELTEKYLQLSKKDAAFCLLYLSSPRDAEELTFMQSLVDLPSQATILGIDRGCLIYISGADSASGFMVAEDLLRMLADAADGQGAYAGISSYPYQGFSKAEALLNARKALLHAEFFGPGHAVQFDAVSLNVSGDIHFSDGDLAGALREYRRGLECAPEDVNLLNSLGVTYALLNKNNLAKNAFERVIAIDSNNFMALYNLGLGAKLQGDLLGALQLFERAYRGCSVDDDKDFCREVEVQLGKLYCRSGRYPESLQFFQSWSEKVGERQQRRILKYLGEAHLGNGDPIEAMGFLQRALQQNAFDHDALSLLGSAIWQAHEGDDIALSLCRKSVDLAPDNPILRFRLARIQQHLGQYAEALESLANCRGRSVDQTEVQLLKASVYMKLNRPDRARFWARKVQKQSVAKSETSGRAQALLDALDQAKLSRNLSRESGAATLGR
ncbi:tetratricopeptide repeat protein [Desulfopila aestuarii]|uniref:Tetratricopeptide repeat-containing protein n=1 Tax=Desulfopila aestuarii DSM 18488 TaxID=1121416 RepID=A0A1M7YGG8_9BACT|nr:tetratricopeptide repeat protein [Desulfopila aestuarii]SHO51686.1 Tetratricopeptide repeat-containing protein [Desulfopila aestuarii DSM 18488]